MIGAIIHSLEDAIADRLPAHTRFGLVEQWNTDQGLRPIQYQGGGQGAVVLQDASLDLSYWRLRGPVEQRTGDNCDEVNLLYPLRLVFLVDRTSDVCADVSGALGEIMLGIRLMERAVQTAIPGASASIVSMRAEGDTSRAVAAEIPGIELPPQRALAFIDIALSITGDTDCLSNCGPYTGSEVVPSDACYYLRVCGTPTDGQVPTSESGRTVWATPGTGPAGSGDVVGPASAVNNNFAAFNLTTGKLIKDSGVSAASFDAAGAASAAQAASQPLDADLTAYANAANPAARRALIGAGTGSGDVVGPASATADSLARFDGTTGKLLKDGLATSTGAGQTADAGKVLIFGPSGGVTAFADGTVSSNGVSAAVIGGPNTNAAIGAQAFDAFAARVVNESTTRPALEAVNDDATNVGPLAHFHRDDNLGMEVANDGSLAWTSVSGGQGTATNLPVFGALTKGVVPAAGAVPAATKYLNETGGWTTPSGGAGDVVGPASSTDNAIARFDLATGKLIQNSGITIADGATGTLSNTNTGDQTISLTGDVTGSGTGSFAATIANDAVTYAKMQNVSATDKLLGRSTAGAGDVEEIACTAAARSVLDDATTGDMLTTLGAEAAANTQRVVLSADFTTNSATFVDVTGLTVTIPAGETWYVQIDGAYQSTNAATGVGVSLTRTGSPTRSNFERRIYTAIATNVMHGAVGNIDDAGPINTTVDTANADRHWIMTGNVKTAASACVIQVRAARGGSANNVSIMAGASIIAHRIS